MMPKSTTAIAPSASTNMFPGWRSAWKKPSRNTWLKKAAAALLQQILDAGARQRASRRGHRYGCRVIRSSGQHGAAGAQPIDPRHRKFGSPAKFSASSAAAAASSRKSISNLTTSASVCTTSTGFSRRSRGLKPLGQSGEPREEVEIAGERGGDARPQHLDGDIVPLRRPGEMDLGDRCRRYRRIDRMTRTARRAGMPNSASIRALRLAAGNGGSRSCRLARSTVISSPRRSARVERSWPSLTKLGPNSSKAAASRWPGRGGTGPRRRANRWPNRTNGAATGTDSQRRQRIVPAERQADPDQARKIADAAQKPELGPERVRGARPNGAQRRPPSDCGI